MVRMSDILKKVEQRRAEAERYVVPEASPVPEAPPRPQPVSSPAPVEASTPPSPPPPQAPVLPPAMSDAQLEEAQRLRMHVVRPIKDAANGLNNDEAILLYMKVVDCVKNLYEKVKNEQEITFEDREIQTHIERFVDEQRLNNDNIVGLITLPPERNYLYNHVVNVAIIAIEIGIGLGYPREELIELGNAAALYDIGMVKFSDLYEQPRKLNAEEFERIRQHPSVSFEILKKFKNISQRIVTIAYQEHEREDGSGYPCGLKGNSIDEFVKIIAVADIYDAVCHPRPYRDALQPYEALNLIIQAKDSLGSRGVRAFIERICCPYPIGCYVRLSTGEKGMVVGRNIGDAFKPILEIMQTSSKSGSQMTRILDLKNTTSVHIKDYLTKREMQELF